MKSLKNGLANANVTVDNIKTALQAIDEMEAEHRSDFTAVHIAVMSAFGLLEKTDDDPNEPISNEKFDLINIVTATMIRIEALLTVADDPKFKAWSMEVSNDDENYILLREDVLTAVAEAPLHEKNELNDKRSYFVPDEFFDILLKVSPESGAA